VSSWPREQRDLLAAEEEVRIETTRPDGSPRRTTIWIVVDGDDVFVRSVRGDRGRWYRDLRARPEGTLVVSGRRQPFRRGQRIAFISELADDPSSIERCSRAIVAKYTGIPGLEPMLEAKALPATLRLMPG
jgi:hypothetical protein